MQLANHWGVYSLHLNTRHLQPVSNHVLPISYATDFTTPTSTACPEAMGDELPSCPPITSCLPVQHPHTKYHRESSSNLRLHQGDAQESTEHGGSIDDLVFLLDNNVLLQLCQGLANFLLVETQEMKMGLSHAFWTSNQFKELVERMMARDCPSHSDMSHAVHKVLDNMVLSIEQQSF